MKFLLRILTTPHRWFMDFIGEESLVRCRNYRQ